MNEISARYSILDREFYLPAPEQIAAQSSANRQGRGELLSTADSDAVLAILREDALRCYDHYQSMLDQHGLARELARMNLTLNTYTQWYWKTDLHNLLNFLSLRADRHAQYEIRAYADIMLTIVQEWVPETYAAFAEYRLGAAVLSATMLAALRRMLAGEAVTQESSGLGKRDWEELQVILGPSPPIRPGVLNPPCL